MKKNFVQLETELNPNLGGLLGVRFEVMGGGGELPTCLKLFTIMLET